MPHAVFFFLLIRAPPTSTLFPYTTLFRSWARRPRPRQRGCRSRPRCRPPAVPLAGDADGLVGEDPGPRGDDEEGVLLPREAGGAPGQGLGGVEVPVPGGGGGDIPGGEHHGDRQDGQRQPARLAQHREAVDPVQGQAAGQDEQEHRGVGAVTQGHQKAVSMARRRISVLKPPRSASIGAPPPGRVGSVVNSQRRISSSRIPPSARTVKVPGSSGNGPESLKNRAGMETTRRSPRRTPSTSRSCSIVRTAASGTPSRAAMSGTVSHSPTRASRSGSAGSGR